QYLRGLSAEYPTVALDADGNERASIYLRQSDFNILQILWQQLLRKGLDARQRGAYERAFLETVSKNRSQWIALVAEIQQEIATMEDFAASRQSRGSGELRYEQYIRTIDRLLSLGPGFSATTYKMEDLIPSRALGEANRIHDLQNYV